jgi:sulfotransferase
MTGPVGGLFLSLMSDFAARNEFAVFIDAARRRAILRALFDAYYEEIHPTKLVFDTNRVWCAKIAALVDLFPDARIVCCVRHLGWIADSVEQIVQSNAFEPSRIFGYDAGGTVYGRVDSIVSGTGFVGYAYNALKEAFYGRFADRLILVQYDSLTRSPHATLDALYRAIGEPAFAHDFENVQFDEGVLFDASFGAPGLHSVRPKVEKIERPTILPPDIFERFANDSFWRDPDLNPNHVTII